jgi:DNA-nicking Smr family endonuclease
LGRTKDQKTKEHDRAVWEAAMRDVRPLSGRRKEVLPAPAPTILEPAPKKPRAPARHPVAAPARPAPAPPAPISRDADISHGKASGIDRRSAERLKRGRLPIEGRLDLHGLTQAAAHERLDEFLARAEAAGKRCVLVITGKGLASGGVLRDQVPRWLNLPHNRARVLAFDYAQGQHGGSGAIYVLLKRRRTP